MQRKPAAVLCLLVVGLLLACGRNGAPNSLFDSAGYHVRDGTVYYLNAFPGKAFEINGADAASFEALDSTYGRDKSTVYINGARLTDADAASFELLDRAGFAKDRRHVFQRDRAISDDPATFQLLAGAYARDDRRVFYFTDQIPVPICRRRNHSPVPTRPTPHTSTGWVRRRPSSRTGPQRVARRGAERRLVSKAEPAGMAEPPAAGDRGDGVVGRVGRLQVVVRAVKPHAPQILQRRRAQVAAKCVLHRAR